MKKLFTLFAAALVMLLAASSCEKNEVLPEGNTEGKVVTLKASINNGGTKTSLGEKNGETYPVLWSEGDAIAVIQTVNEETKTEAQTSIFRALISTTMIICKTNSNLFFYMIAFQIFGSRHHVFP